jgi:prophage regulatory protein
LVFNSRREVTMPVTVPAKADARRVSAPQPLHAAQIADALLKLQTVQALTGLSKTTLYAKAAAGELTPIRLGKRCTRWKAGDVTAWLQAQGK